MSTTRTIARLAWPEVDPSVRAELEGALGSAVVGWESQEEGFSPGVAARCRLADGRRVFIKAVSGDVNAMSQQMSRYEVDVNRALPPEAPAPRMLAAVDQDPWIAAAWEDIDGHQPLPWTDETVAAVFDAVDALALAPAGELMTVEESLGDDFQGWRKLAAGDIGADPGEAGIEPWLTPTLIDRLAALETDWVAAAPPEALVHCDIRADNLLVDRHVGDGRRRVWVVDWANAAIGPPWLDVVGMIPPMAMQTGRHPAELWALSRHAGVVDPAAVDVLVVALAGYFTEAARRPPVPVIPMLRNFQEAQARPARAWVRQRLGLT